MSKCIHGLSTSPSCKDPNNICLICISPTNSKKELKNTKMTKQLLTPKQRWEQGLSHHENSLRIKALVNKIQDQEDYGIEFGGDGDEGETWLYMLDEFFESQDD